MRGAVSKRASNVATSARAKRANNLLGRAFGDELHAAIGEAAMGTARMKAEKVSPLSDATVLIVMQNSIGARNPVTGRCEQAIRAFADNDGIAGPVRDVGQPNGVAIARGRCGHHAVLQTKRLNI